MLSSLRRFQRLSVALAAVGGPVARTACAKPASGRRRRGAWQLSLSPSWRASAAAATERRTAATARGAVPSTSGESTPSVALAAAGGPVARTAWGRRGLWRRERASAAVARTGRRRTRNARPSAAPGTAASGQVTRTTCAKPACGRRRRGKPACAIAVCGGIHARPSRRRPGRANRVPFPAPCAKRRCAIRRRLQRASAAVARVYRR